MKEITIECLLCSKKSQYDICEACEDNITNKVISIEEILYYNHLSIDNNINCDLLEIY